MPALRCLLLCSTTYVLQLTYSIGGVIRQDGDVVGAEMVALHLLQGADIAHHSAEHPPRTAGGKNTWMNKNLYKNQNTCRINNGFFPSKDMQTVNALVNPFRNDHLYIIDARANGLKLKKNHISDFLDF